MSRLNVVADNDALEKVMKRYGLATKRAAIDLALAHLLWGRWIDRSWIR